ncbi:DUF3017 domain-containing protein [Streptomyces sp. NPDC058572]|uniref:DUF3017 domain-containing protein n=1 Tax=Streptomyces sp. NPDC058572 TaxID=3346546 RepID=UPI00364EDDDD
MGVRTNGGAGPEAAGAAEPEATRAAEAAAGPEPEAVAPEGPAASTGSEGSETGTGPEAASGDSAPAPGPDAPGSAKKGSRRPPAVTRDTARPEGGGRAAPGDAPAPARQWPLLTVLVLTGLGLLIVGMDAFADAFRVGTILIGVALITGAVLRRVLPSVGMLAVRSRFTDMITYGLLGTVIVLLALVTQPAPWLDVPFLEDVVHFTVR